MKALVRIDNDYMKNLYRDECLFTDGQEGVEIRIEEGVVPSIVPGVLADYYFVENIDSIPPTPTWYEGDGLIHKYINGEFIISDIWNE